MRATLTLSLVAVLLAAAEPPAAKAIREKFAANKPTEQELAFFGLAWECDLASAKARAKADGRPVVAVLVHNITASCDFFSGHT